MTETRTVAGAALQLESLTKRYGEDAPPAVNDVTLEIAAGEFMTLLGPSGSGKTTTLNIVAGFVTQSSGRVLIDGADIAALPPYRRNLGFVFQSYALFPHMTVAQNIAYPLARRQVPKAEARRRVAEIMDLVQLGHLAARKPAELSGGQQQRVALARALVFRPRALLLDEPLAALDRQLRESLQDELRRLHRELGVTVVLVTHDQQEALHLSDRIAVFNHGSIEQVGTPRDLYEHPTSAFVARFLGESTFIPGVIEEGGAIDVAGDRLPAPPGARAAAGTAVAIVVRPEAIRLGPESAGLGTLDVVRPATITDLVYRGTSVRASARLDSDVQVLATLEARHAAHLRVGERIVVGWNADETAIVPAAGQTTPHAMTGAAV